MAKRTGGKTDMQIVGVAWLLACAMCAPALAMGAEAGRGRALYDTACNRCHDTSVHARRARKAKSFPAIRAQVVRWSTELGAGWSREEIDDVTVYLNGRYYFFECPQLLCRVGPTASDIGRRSDIGSGSSEVAGWPGIALAGGVLCARSRSADIGLSGLGQRRETAIGSKREAGPMTMVRMQEPARTSDAVPTDVLHCIP